jgi:hypothetical protein
MSNPTKGNIMKTKTITLALVAAFAGFAATAKADHTRVNVGIGFDYGPPAAAPVYVPAPVVVPRAEFRYNDRHDRGHWETVTTKVWVPARWVSSRDRWGRPVRVLENGFYTFRTDRVWVDHGNHRYGYRG